MLNWSEMSLMQGIFSNSNGINLFLMMIFPYTSLHFKVVLVHYREYDNNLVLMLFHRTSLHWKQVPVQEPRIWH